ncbi:MAG TPA: TetR/AcrR family transcriptional regulator [Polyangia bacterium]|nr:TetR/AcrR family transcriptional regulator [Polyangia bacterium]
MEKKRSRILETAIDLAEKGGFENVRLRDVAAQAEVALGTLYKRFPSKESILIAALEMEAEKLERRMSKKAIEGATPLDRVLGFFDTASRTLFRKPNLGRAVLRALTSGDAELTVNVAGFHQRMTNMIVAAFRGSAAGNLVPEPTNSEMMVAFIAQQIWFAALVGWMGGLITKAMVIDQLRITLVLLLRGLEKEGL